MIMNAREFLRLRTSENAEDYVRASTEGAPLKVWTGIVENFPDMKIWVARNKTVPVEVLRRLAADSARDVRLAVATKNKLPEDLMMLLAADVDESVRERVAFNKNAPTAILEDLANDPIERIALKACTRLTTGAWRILKQP
jgi:hypothetical protein